MSVVWEHPATLLHWIDLEVMAEDKVDQDAVAERLEASVLESPKFKRDFQTSQSDQLSKTAEGETVSKKALLGDRTSLVLPKLWKLLPDNVCHTFPQLDIVPKPILKLMRNAESIIVRLKEVTSSEEKKLKHEAEQALTSIQGVLDQTWEQLNTGHWRDVPIVHRHVFSIASLIKILCLLYSQAGGEEMLLRLALKAADMGLLLGAPLPPPNECLDLTIAASLLSTTLAQLVEQSGSEQDPIILDEKQTSQFITGGLSGSPIKELVCPSIERFCTDHFQPKLPVKIKGCMTHWPAYKRWNDIGYLQRVAGARTVPIELGSHYAHSDYSQKLMTIADFIEQHVVGGKLGYLAQHQLFEQVPELRADICEPEYCCLTDDSIHIDEPANDGTDINAWFGPAGTVSPLHFDPKHNLLAQVVGTKRVLLFPPEVSSSLYPHSDRLLSNTARVDPEKPDYDQFPLFKNIAPPIEFSGGSDSGILFGGNKDKLLKLLVI
ncbi:Bifunctional peptidase and arginyl-hydroxylase JMJD5 [Frankliniella fusca]|uniref:JmjC domain-containing protein 5 n=1 Tax=Frankliniella fusca TaxID=407009 RepID=A0AAE1H4Z2_9NEOP|nr:Bifunctional peptidase and arginyl-hydroxylase JMJD5 [Frankliniella fusca]